MMKYCSCISAIVLFFLAMPFLHAQKQNNVWYFGYGFGIDFNGPAPVLLTSGKIRTLEGSASVADKSTGALLFYTDGVLVWNRNHVQMPNGYGLKGHFSSTQSALIIPVPGSATRYYIFTSDEGGYLEEPNDGVHYSIVDMQADGGRGDVVMKNARLMTHASERMVAVGGCGDTYWVIVVGKDSDEMHVFRVTSAGISPPVIFPTGSQFPGSVNTLGYLKASPSGKRLAMMVLNEGVVQLFDFDPETGVVSNPMTLNFNGEAGLYGLAFSPDNTKLYMPSALSAYYGISQFDLTSNDLTQIMASRKVVGDYCYAMQLGPDRKLYCKSTSISVIEQPNLAGAACGYVRDLFLLGDDAGLGLPNMVDTDHSAGTPPVSAGRDTVICVGGSARLVGTGADVYEWGPATSLSCTDCPAPIASPKKTTTYYLYGRITGTSCAGLDSVTVTVLPPPSVSAGPDQAICSNGSVQLEATGGTEFRWIEGEGLSCTDCPSPIARPVRTGRYIVEVRNSAGCVAFDTVVITVTGTPQASAGPDVGICMGESTQLQASAGIAWQWSPSTGLDCSDCRSPIASPQVTTTYTVTVTSPGDCKATDTVVVTVHDLPDVNVGADTVLCLGVDLALHATGGVSYRWEPSPDLSCTDCPNPIARPRRNAVYIVTAYNEHDCFAADTIRVVIILDSLTHVAPDTTICRGDEVVLRASGGISYQWSPADGLSCTDCPEPSARPSQTTAYTVTITNKLGCMPTDTIVVTVQEPPVAGAGADTTLCSGGELMLHATGGVSYRWESSPDLSCTDCPNPLVRPSATTDYIVTVYNEYGCAAVDTVQVRVVLDASANAGPDALICTGDEVMLRGSGGTSYQWSPADGLSCTDCPEPIARPSQTTTYTLTVINAAGCISSDRVRVGIRGYKVFDAYIPQNYRTAPGGVIAVPVMLRDPSAIDMADTLVLGISYRATVLRLQSANGVLLAGWQTETITDSLGAWKVRFIAPQGWQSNGTDTLLMFQFNAYLGDTLIVDIPLTAEIANAGCTGLQTSPGRVMLDSICGLNFRMIELIPGFYDLKPNRPNPFGSLTSIEFSIGLDGPARLEVLDARGEPIALLVNHHLDPGTYTVQWDAGPWPAGLYYYRLVSGTWSQTERMMLVK